MANEKRVQVAAIHSHFNIFRNINEKGDGPITRDEQIEALKRFVRWHERQVEVGNRLLSQLIAANVDAVIVETSPDPEPVTA